MELNDITEFLHAAARSVGAEVTSPWFYLQLGLILAAAGIAFATGATIRSRIDMTSLAMGWPTPLRLFMRVLVGSALDRGVRGGDDAGARGDADHRPGRAAAICSASPPISPSPG